MALFPLLFSQWIAKKKQKNDQQMKLPHIFDNFLYYLVFTTDLCYIIQRCLIPSRKHIFLLYPQLHKTKQQQQQKPTFILFDNIFRFATCFMDNCSLLQGPVYPTGNFRWCYRTRVFLSQKMADSLALKCLWLPVFTALNLKLKEIQSRWNFFFHFC